MAKYHLTVVSFNVSGVFVTLQTVVCQASLSIGFSRQEYWSRLPCPPPGDLPDPGIEFASPPGQGVSLPLSHLGSPIFEVTES